MKNKDVIEFLANLYSKYGDLPFDPIPKSEENNPEYKEKLIYSIKAGFLKIFTEEDLDNVIGAKLQKGDQVIFSMRGREFVQTGGM